MARGAAALRAFLSAAFESHQGGRRLAHLDHGVLGTGLWGSLPWTRSVPNDSSTCPASFSGGRAHSTVTCSGLQGAALTPDEPLSRISPWADVHPRAYIGEGVSVGPFCIVGPNVRIEDGCQLLGNNAVVGNTVLGPNCVLRQGAVIGSEDPGWTRIGKNNEFGHHAVIGARCQDLKYRRGEECYLSIGDGNDIREHVTIHRSSRSDVETAIGNNNLLMVACHVAHDVSIRNNCLLAGHVLVGDCARISGACAVQPRVHLGSFCYLTGGSMVDRDVPPYTIVQGDRAAIRGVNEVLMQRCGFSLEQKQAVREAFRVLMSSFTHDQSTIHESALQAMQRTDQSFSHALHMLQFVVTSCSKRREDDRVGGICRFQRNSVTCA